MFVGGSLLHLWLQNTVVLPGKACVYPLFTLFLLFFSHFSPIFISVSSSEEHSSLQTDSAVLVCAWVTFPCVFCFKGWEKISSSDHAGLNVSVNLVFRGRIWDMNWPFFFCSACSSFTENMRLMLAAMCLVVRTSPYSLVLHYSPLPSCCFEVCPVFNQKTNSKKESTTQSLFLTFAVIPRSVWQLESIWQFQL